MSLNFPDPAVTQTYTEAGITWTWNSGLGVWSSDTVSADADDLYLSKVNDDAAAGAITFQDQTTHEEGINVTGGRVNSNGTAGGLIQSKEHLYISANELDAPTNTFIILNTDSSSGTTMGSNHSIDGDVSARQLHVTYGGTGHLLQFTNILSDITSSVSGVGSDANVYGVESTISNQNTAGLVAGFRTSVKKSNNAGGAVIAYLSSGDAMSLFRGDLRVTQETDANQEDWRPGGGSLNKGFRWDTERNIGNMCGDDSTVFNVTQNNLSGRLMNFFTNGNAGVCGKIEPLTNTTCSYSAGNGGTFVNTSDYRIKTDVVDLEDAADVVKQLRPISFKYTDADKTHIGFIAHELQEHVPSAVQGTKDETQEVGTLYNRQGEVIETGIVQPKNLSVTKVVIDDNDVETQINETRSWVKTGTEPVYQGVDQSKLIPLLTKALQEALERIEVLEANQPGG